MAYHFLNFWLRKIVYFNWLNSIYSSNINSIQFNPLTFKIIQFRPSVKICHIVAVSFYFCQFSILLFKGLHLFGLDLFLFQNTLCVGQFCPMFKLCGRRPGPILSSFIQIEQGRAQPNIRCEGKRISEDSQPKNGQNYRPRRGGAYL